MRQGLEVIRRSTLYRICRISLKNLMPIIENLVLLGISIIRVLVKLSLKQSREKQKFFDIRRSKGSTKGSNPEEQQASEEPRRKEPEGGNLQPKR